MRVLALDTSTSCGWAFRTLDGYLEYGTEPFNQRDWPQRWHRFNKWLCDTISRAEPDIVAVEAPYYSGGDSLGITGFGVVAQMTAQSYGLEIRSVGNMTIKKHAEIWKHFVERYPEKTTRPELTTEHFKTEMIAAAERRGWHVRTDHEADALLLADYILERCHE